MDNPQEFARILPGFLPATLDRVDPGATDPAGDDFLTALRADLFGASCPDLLIAGDVPGDDAGFWTSCHLAGWAPVSQYDALRRVLADRRDLPGHVFCLALSGAGFHGQQKRTWVAKPGNLHLSVGLRCDLSAAQCGLALTTLPAVALMDALSVLLGQGLSTSGPGIKWVNDIQIDGRKIGGVLTSARSQEGRVRSVVLGIGLNVLRAPAVPATIFTPGTTCLGDVMSLPADGLTKILRLVLSALERRFRELEREGPEPLLKAYRAASVVLGREVEIYPDGQTVGEPRRGRVMDIGQDLELILTDDPEPVTAGRLVLLPRHS